MVLALTRRTVLATAAAAPAMAQAEPRARRAAVSGKMTLSVNGRTHSLALDPRTTLLDTLREHLSLTGTKKGCDHGQPWLG